MFGRAKQARRSASPATGPPLTVAVRPAPDCTVVAVAPQDGRRCEGSVETAVGHLADPVEGRVHVPCHDDVEGHLVARQLQVRGHVVPAATLASPLNRPPCRHYCSFDNAGG